jgi:class 3 adenylate cyclase
MDSYFFSDLGDVLCCQNSTVMWEKLPMALMEEVLRVHHTTLRSLLDKHNGYESATEGDSFILAFHSPSDALAYAIEAQQCLLAASWPHELLDKCEEARITDVIMYALDQCP